MTFLVRFTFAGESRRMDFMTYPVPLFKMKLYILWLIAAPPISSCCRLEAMEDVDRRESLDIAVANKAWKTKGNAEKTAAKDASNLAITIPTIFSKIFDLLKNNTQILSFQLQHIGLDNSFWLVFLERWFFWHSFEKRKFFQRLNRKSILFTDWFDCSCR